MAHPIKLRSPAKLAATALASSLLAACATKPLAVEPVSLPTGDAGTFEGERADISLETPSAEWWQGFGDVELTGLVERALSNSPTLRRADFDVAVAEAELRQIDLNRSFRASSQSTATFSEPAGRTEDPDLDLRGSVNASWEFDVWGRLRALVESAEASAEGVRQARRDLAVIITSETALAYIDLRGAQRRLEVARLNAAAQAEGLELIETLRDNGRGTQLDFDRAETVYRTTLASLPVFEADIDDAVARLSALTGTFATNGQAEFADLVAVKGPAIPQLEGPLAIGSPDEMLERRPDVRLAEAQLAGALALTAATRAELFPQITLNASATGLFRPQSNFGVDNGFNPGFSVGPAIQWAGPDLRRVYARIDAADARAMALAAAYEETVLDALADAQIAISSYIQERNRRADLVAAAGSAQSALLLATRRFEEGLDDYLDVLDAQRTRLDAEDRLALSQLETARRAIRAYRSLGGVWDTDALTAYRAG